MIVLPSEQIVYFDVDDTIIIWDVPKHLEDKTIVFDNFGVPVKLLPHFKHIEQMKKHKARGHVIVCWSAGGYAWAEAVVKTLNLEQYVDLVLSKPNWVYDDLPASEFIPEINRVYYKIEDTK